VSSPMLHYVYSKSTWGAILQMDPSYINEITLKGGPADSENGDYYRAIHLHLVTKSGLPYEIQVQSKGMAFWHKWDHKTVFKGPYEKGSVARHHLKQYSNAWARVIRWLEAATTNGETRWNSLTTIMNDYGVQIDIKDIHWLSDLDKQLSLKYQIPREHGFFYDDPKLSTHERRDAYMYIFKLWTHLNDGLKVSTPRRERR
ncbi:MAG TPA: hypothetical protein PLU50_06835, partial [Pseudobdellovibrionaceae bacterium]|nr:hypothetical protein [Pseudobdellovibrionaceae bacterium]